MFAQDVASKWVNNKHTTDITYISSDYTSEIRELCLVSTSLEKVWINSHWRLPSDKIQTFCHFRIHTPNLGIWNTFDCSSYTCTKLPTFDSFDFSDNILFYLHLCIVGTWHSYHSSYFLVLCSMKSSSEKLKIWHIS